MTGFLGVGASILALLIGLPASAMGVCVEGELPALLRGARRRLRSSASTSTSPTRSAREIGETCELVRVSWDRHDPGADGRAVRCDHRLDVRHRRAARADRLHRRATTRCRCASSGAAGSALSDAPDALAGKVVGVQRGTINQAFMTAHYPATPLQALRQPGACASRPDLRAARRGARRGGAARRRLSPDTPPATASPSSARTISTRRSRARAPPSACARRTRRSGTACPRRSRRSAPTAATTRSRRGISTWISTAIERPRPDPTSALDATGCRREPAVINPTGSQWQ